MSTNQNDRGGKQPSRLVSDRFGLWIPATIWHDRRLTLIDKILLSDIVSMIDNGMEYYKTNERIANDVQCSIATAKRSLSSLQNMGYIEISYTPNRTIRVAQIAPGQNDPAQNEPSNGSKRTGDRLKMNRPPAQNEPHNISLNKPIKEPLNNPPAEILMPFPDHDFAEAWAQWKSERKTRRLRAYTEQGEITQLHRLQKISNHNVRTAIDIIHQSIAQGWQGLFPLKPDGTRPNANPVDYDELASYIRDGAG